MYVYVIKGYDIDLGPCLRRNADRLTAKLLAKCAGCGPFSVPFPGFPSIPVPVPFAPYNVESIVRRNLGTISPQEHYTCKSYSPKVMSQSLEPARLLSTEERREKKKKNEGKRKKKKKIEDEYLRHY